MDHSSSIPMPTSGLASWHEPVARAAGQIPDSLILLAARVFPAAVFWQSGRTKMDGLAVRDATFFLFENEYALPLIPPDIAAYLAVFAEHLFPMLLVLGLATRLSALALLGMTLVIQVFVYPGAWVTHGLWATCLLLLVAKGAGAVSVDRLVTRHLAGSAPG